MIPPPRIADWTGLLAGEILLALDYDGTLSPIVSRPEDAAPDDGLLELLGDLDAAPGIRIVVLSGRPVATLAEWLPLSSAAFIGTHGAEWRPPGGDPAPLLAPAEARAAAGAAAAALEAALAGIPGSQVERKPFGVAAHHRRVRGEDLADFRRAFASARAASDQRLELHEGKKVLELRWPGVEKGPALAAVRAELAWEGLPALALGDDRTDESTFASLSEGDLCVHVGPGPTGAPFAVPDVRSARALLRELLRSRGGDRASERP